MSKSRADSVNPKHLFLKDLFLLQKNKRQKLKIPMKNRDSKLKLTPSSKPINRNAISDGRMDEISTSIRISAIKVYSSRIVLIISRFIKDKKHHQSSLNDGSIEGQYFYDEGFQEKSKS